MSLVALHRVRFFNRQRLLTLCDIQQCASYSTSSGLGINAARNVSDANDAGTGTNLPRLTTDQEAIALFKAFHVHNSPFYLGPGRFVLTGEEYTWKRARVPFWVFKGVFRYQYKLASDSEWSSERRIHLDESDEAMQACATFRYRHDFVDKLKCPQMPHVNNLFSDSGYKFEMEHFIKENVDVSRGLAWDFVLRNVERKVWDQLCLQHQDTRVRVRIRGMPHSSKQVYIPAHIIFYSFGEKVDVHNERSKDRFYALVNGLGGRVASETHVSVRKAAAVGGSLSICLMSLASLLGYSSVLGWSGFDYGFIGAGSAAMGALLAQVLQPGTQKQFEPVEANAQHSYDWDTLEDLYRSEWDRWSLGSVAFDLEPDKRRRWAESIWSGHRSRVKRFREALKELAASKRREREREKRRERLERRWGPVESRVNSGKRDRDYLGYYAALGLDGNVSLSKHDIKKAFLRKVRALHPDSHQGQQQASREWLQVVEAYDVLRDEETRRKYDSGDFVRDN